MAASKPFLVLSWLLPPAGRGDTESFEALTRLLPWAIAEEARQRNIPTAPDGEEIDCLHEPEARASMAVCVLPIGRGRRGAWADAVDDFSVSAHLDRIVNCHAVATDLSHTRALAAGRLVRITDDLVPPLDIHPAVLAHLDGQAAPLQAVFEEMLDSHNPRPMSRATATWFSRKRPLGAVYVKPLKQKRTTSEAPSRTDIATDAAGRIASRRGQFDAVTDAAVGDVAALVELPRTDRIIETTLDNGLRVIIAPFGDVPVARTTRILPGGWGDPEHRPADAWLSLFTGPKSGGPTDDHYRGLPDGLDRSLERIAGRTSQWQGGASTASRWSPPRPMSATRSMSRGCTRTAGCRRSARSCARPRRSIARRSRRRTGP